MLVDALNTKSLVLGGQGRHEEQQALLERAIALARENDAPIPLLRALNNLGVQLMVRADFAAARRTRRKGSSSRVVWVIVTQSSNASVHSAT